MKKNLWYTLPIKILIVSKNVSKFKKTTSEFYGAIGYLASLDLLNQ